MAPTVVKNADQAKTKTAVVQPSTKKKKSSGPQGFGKASYCIEDALRFLSLSRNGERIHQPHILVACDVASLYVITDKTSIPLSSALQVARERDEFKFCHAIAVSYNLLLVVERQANLLFGVRSSIASNEMVMLHDVTASCIEAFSAMVLPDGVKLSTSEEYIALRVKRMVKALSALSLKKFFDFELDESDYTSDSFPLKSVLDRWEVLQTKVARFCGNQSNWRVPSCGPEVSILDAGVVLVDQSRFCVSSRPLPQKLEKLCLALGLVEFTEHGDSGYIPQAVHDDRDDYHMILRCRGFSDKFITYHQALEDLTLGMVSFSRD